MEKLKQVRSSVHQPRARQARRRKGRKGFSAGLILLGVFAGLASVRMWGWGSRPHSQIVDAALSVIPPEDALSQRLGTQALELRMTVLMADWSDRLVQITATSYAGAMPFTIPQYEYFSNDYLFFPKSTRSVNHSWPGVQLGYTPFFLRSLQALRTESPSNAARWIGSLLHYVTDSGSPPHAIGIKGDDHTKMENWLDASKIDLRGYHPVLLGSTDKEAAAGLEAEMRTLNQENSPIARREVPLAEANDKASIAVMSLVCATNTAKVTADVIHTLLTLSQHASQSDTGAITATVVAPNVQDLSMLPAKLVLLRTDYSTTSEAATSTGEFYSGSFDLHNIPVGSYQAAIERPGAKTIFTKTFTVAKGHTIHFDFRMQPSAAPGNLVRNPDFRLHWVSADAPDHWHFDSKENSWISDNIAIKVGATYEFWADATQAGTTQVSLQWMQESWQPLAAAPIRIDSNNSAANPGHTQAPGNVLYARLCVAGAEWPRNLNDVVLRMQQDNKQ